MDAYVGSVGFSSQGPSQIWTYMPKQIPSQFRQQYRSVVSRGSGMFKGRVGRPASANRFETSRKKKRFESNRLKIKP